METSINNKRFYVPQIEEFCVGFEFEILEKSYNKTVKWVKKSWSIGMMNQKLNEDFLEEDQVRVKYLDREGIESLGFEFSKSKYEGDLFLAKKECKFGSNSPKFYELILGQREDICLSVEEHTSYGSSNQKMYFKVKNKSELKRLLRQIGYED